MFSDHTARGPSSTSPEPVHLKQRPSALKLTGPEARLAKRQPSPGRAGLCEYDNRAPYHVHVIYSTYNRQDLIPPAFEKRLYPFVAEIAREHKIPLLAAGGMPNHSHLLFLLPPTMSLADAVNKMSAAPTALGCHIHVTQPFRDWAHIWPAGPPALRFWKFINPDPILLSRSRSMRSTLWIAQLRIFNREGRGLPFELECLRQNPTWMLV
ncbi:MAG: hypothetical protein DMG62_20980 [Acidobacteria bacterium]|nr:MAG: hypothetical protein DMG62_20980 [Acidobacteriota bacterium]